MAFIYRVASTASQDRLEKLIEERLKPKADQARIDEKIWNLFGERWAVKDGRGVIEDDTVAYGNDGKVEGAQGVKSDGRQGLRRPQVPA